MSSTTKRDKTIGLNKAKLGAKFEAKLRTIEMDSLRVATDPQTQNRFTPDRR